MPLHPAHSQQNSPSRPGLFSLGRALFRALRLTVLLLTGMLLALPYPSLRTSQRLALLRWWSATLLRVVGIRTVLPEHPLIHSGGMLIANHVSWLDIMVINAFHPTVFVAKAEVRRWPLIGWLCARSGTLFIHREQRQDLARLNQELAQRIAAGEWVASFPEGTTTTGETAGHFHPSLLQPAVDCGSAVLPLALRYYTPDGMLAEHAAFVGEQTFAASLLAILLSPGMSAVLLAGDALDGAQHNRRTLAAAAQQTVAELLSTAIPPCDEAHSHEEEHFNSYSLLLDNSLVRSTMERLP